MKTQKLSLANIQGKLSRAMMKDIMAGGCGGSEGIGSGSGCPANGCGAGNAGTCKTGLVNGTLACVCSDERGSC